MPATMQRFYYKTWIITLKVIYNATFGEGLLHRKSLPEVVAIAI